MKSSDQVNVRRWIAGALVVLFNFAVAAPYAVRAVNQVGEYKADWRDSDTGFINKTDSRATELELKPVATHVRMRVAIRVHEGTVRFRLLDPRGKVRLQGSATQSKGSFDTREIPAIFGAWKFEIERQGASGEWEAHWRVR